MRLKLSLTLPLSALRPVAIPGEATRTPQLTIGDTVNSLPNEFFSTRLRKWS